MMGEDPRRKRIVFVAALPLSINVFMRPHIHALKEDYEIGVLANGSAADFAGLLDQHVSFYPVRIEREISLKRDFLALIRLWRVFRKEKFDCVHSITPKAGLLSMWAALFAGVPRRLHTFTGQVWATRKGFSRFFLKALDKILVGCATRVLADSHSQRRFLIENRVVKPGAIDVLADGSVAGVDLERFKPNAEARHQIRSHHKIPEDSVVLLYLGRLHRDKGIRDLVRAFAAVAAEKSTRLQLMVVGPDEEGFEAEVAGLADRFPGRVHRIGFCQCPEDYMAAADVFCLPSYREGFGVVIIEAAAVGLPAIASRIYGVTDAVEEGQTGILHLPASVTEIADAMLRLATDDDLRERMGLAARERVASKFSEERVTRALVGFYRNQFSKSADS